MSGSCGNAKITPRPRVLRGGLILGILLGVVLTLVFTPRRGDETRAAVASLAHEAKEKTASLVHRQDAETATDFGDAAAIEREFGGPET